MEVTYYTFRGDKFWNCLFYQIPQGQKLLEIIIIWLEEIAYKKII